jgi:hypothetical protein
MNIPNFKKARLPMSGFDNGLVPVFRIQATGTGPVVDLLKFIKVPYRTAIVCGRRTRKTVWLLFGIQDPKKQAIRMIFA